MNPEGLSRSVVQAFLKEVDREQENGPMPNRTLPKTEFSWEKVNLYFLIAEINCYVMTHSVSAGSLGITGR